MIQAIVDMSLKLKEWDCTDDMLGIQVIQIGYDKDATAFLKELDDDLQVKYKAPFDLVDTVPMSEVANKGGLKNVLLNAIND